MNAKIAAGALGLVLLATAAWAQADAPPPPPPGTMPPGTEAGGVPPPPPGIAPPPPGAMMEGGMGGPRGHGPRHGPRGFRDGPPPPPPSKAAEFRFKHGALEMTFRCAEDEPIKPCADAALTLMDKFGALAASLPDAPPPPQPSPPPAEAP